MVDGGVGIETPDDPQRDDAGRRDDSPGFDIQARIFAVIGAFFTFIALVYGFLTYEWAGTVMLSLAGGLAFTIGAYLGWKKPPAARRSTRPSRRRRARSPGSRRPASGPSPSARALVLVANGLLLGLWLLLPAAALLAYAPRRLRPAVEGPRLTRSGVLRGLVAGDAHANGLAGQSVAGGTSRRRHSQKRSSSVRMRGRSGGWMPLAMSRAWSSWQSR